MSWLRDEGCHLKPRTDQLCAEDRTDLELRDKCLYISCVLPRGIYHFHCFHASNTPQAVKDGTRETK